MGRPWWYDNYWKKKGHKLSKPKDEFAEHFERQRGSRKDYKSYKALTSFWVIVISLLFIVVILILVGYILWGQFGI